MNAPNGRGNRECYVVRYTDTLNIIGAFPFQDDANDFKLLMLERFKRTKNVPRIEVALHVIKPGEPFQWVWNDSERRD